MRQNIKRAVCKLLGKKIYLKIMYKRFFGRRLNLDNPQCFTEKIYWLKVYNGKYQKELIQRCYDKYRVREYISEKGYDTYLNKLYGVYENAECIEFDKLPNKCIFKITQSCGMNLVVTDINKIDECEIKQTLNGWLNDINNLGSQKDGVEDYVFDGKAKIICEELLSESDSPSLKDYSIYCFNGKPSLISCEIGVDNKEIRHIRNTYDLEWNLLPIDFGRERCEDVIFEKPKCINEVIDFAEAIASDFVFARIDGYIIDNNFIFGEITWIPMGGNLKMNSIENDEQIGALLALPNVKLF